ncbi:acrosomal protein SP-10 isoform X1 [Delphinapterus leucas]|uniref:Acrosomal protein SP-10 isoform X1 n=1 Tax=Delphinapterus leucas TaxID=9749 RepID=A0A2Y9M4X2_DELLE|nr:acrosomal protein SP-10 isoform X1 [Delphinapterus leucas]
MKKCLLLVSLYLLGSARGASGQSDELPGSMDHQASVQQPSGENTLSEHGSSEHTAAEHASGERDAVEHASGGHSAVKHASRGHAAGGHAAGEHASSEQPSGEKTSGERSAGEQPSGIPPSSTISGPVLNCHTCSYMNDQGKCLQGEGVCSTQNSQQCMLKKIFEGGKLQFIVQGCENMCPSMNHLSHGTRMQVICCRNQSFCNKV